MSVKIALAGNPNCGKTTLFNALTGSNQFVGNWPGVTVEKKEGKLKGHKDVVLTDLPGIYSLSPYTLEEVVARNYILQEKPDAIINIVDGTNIERNLYLTTQILELVIPVPFRAEIVTTSQPSFFFSLSICIVSPFFSTISIMLTAMMTGIPSSRICVVRYRLRSILVPSTILMIASGFS